MFKRILIYLIPLFLTALIFAVSGKEEVGNEDSKSKAIAVKTAKVITITSARPIITSGKLATTSEIKLSFLTGGIIDDISAGEGQMVAKGQLLATLKLDEINAMANKAKIALDKSQRDHQRIMSLYADKVATLENLQDIESKLEVDKANLEIAEYNLKHSAIYAPSNGRILKRLAENGELAGKGAPIFLFGTSGQGWVVKSGVTDREVIKLAIGDSAHVIFDAYPKVKFRARVTEIAGFANPLTGMFEIELTLPASKYVLKSGFVAEAAISPSAVSTSSMIPVDAIVEADGDKGFVFAIDEQTGNAVKKEVVIDYLTDNKAAVSNGLENIKEVITDGSAYLTDNSKVELSN